jgi:hypothetical protein
MRSQDAENKGMDRLPGWVGIEFGLNRARDLLSAPIEEQFLLGVVEAEFRHRLNGAFPGNVLFCCIPVLR